MDSKTETTIGKHVPNLELLQEFQGEKGGASYSQKQKARRNDMRSVLSTLNSILPPNNRRQGAVNILDQTKEYISYSEDRKRDLEKKKLSKEFQILLKEKIMRVVTIEEEADMDLQAKHGFPCVKVREIGDLSYEVLVDGTHKGFPLSVLLNVVQDAGAIICSANLSSLNDMQFISILCKFADPSFLHMGCSFKDEVKSEDE